MKKTIIISIICFFFYSCVSSQIEDNSTQKYYFYFDKIHPKMMTYGSKKVKYLYRLTYSDPVIFIPYDFIEKEIKIRKLKKYKPKDYNWLNKLNNSTVGNFFYRSNGNKEFYIIEKRDSNKVLYLMRVYFIQEYE